MIVSSLGGDIPAR
jgi:hypothetical protein